MKYCIDDKIIQELGRLLQKTLNLPEMSLEDRIEHLTQVAKMLERVKNKQYDLTSERRLV